jgi:uncharacterized protein
MEQRLVRSLGVAGNRRSFWLRHLHRWHWISSALCLVAMILFAATGFTLNHAGSIPATPVTVNKDATLARGDIAGPESGKHPLPAGLRAAAARALGVAIPNGAAEWSADEIYLDLAGPGVDGSLTIDRRSGALTYEHTSRGWVSFFNDLHKGRNTGAAWRLFIDLFAVAALVFAITGLFLLQLHAGNRPATWPLVGFGLLFPLILLILFVHQ